MTGGQWGIALVVGFLSLPIGVVIRLIPDDIFGFLFFSSSAREKYLGGGNSSMVPSVYMAGADRMPWNPTERSNTMRSRTSKHNDASSLASGSIRSFK